jgi:uncharacterized coiled-coil protein SlyX
MGPPLCFAAIILFGIAGLAASIASDRTSYQTIRAKYDQISEQLTTSYERKFAAQETLIAALNRKSDALETLVEQQQRNLALYRQMPTKTNPISEDRK